MKKQIYKWIFYKAYGLEDCRTIDADIKKMRHDGYATSWHDFYLGVFTEE
jgi:hypothetical protein